MAEVRVGMLLRCTLRGRAVVRVTELTGRGFRYVDPDGLFAPGEHWSHGGRALYERVEDAQVVVEIDR